jgi:hypothetical protein
MADSLGAEQQCIQKIAVRISADTQRLTTVEEKRYANFPGRALVLELEELRNKGLERFALLLLSYKVESCQKSDQHCIRRHQIGSRYTHLRYTQRTCYPA